MIDNYVKSLIDGLRQKEEILDKLIEATNHQQKIISAEVIDWEEFDKVVDEKSEMIDRLNALDDGFQVVFDRVKDELKEKKSVYKDYIETLQSGVKRVTEKSTSLMALEERTKAKVTATFATERRKIVQSKSKNRVANSYYNNMNRMNFIDPQLMDQKK